MAPDPTFALGELFDQHASYVYRVLARFGVRDADLDDLTQEVFLVVLRRYADFEGRSRVRTWLYSIARLCASNYRQRAVHRREVLEEPPSDEGVAGRQAETLDAQRLLGRLDAVLEALPETQREVYVLYEIEQLSMAEISEIMQCSVNTSYARLRAARQVVRAAFASSSARSVA